MKPVTAYEEYEDICTFGRTPANVDNFKVLLRNAVMIEQFQSVRSGDQTTNTYANQQEHLAQIFYGLGIFSVGNADPHLMMTVPHEAGHISLTGTASQDETFSLHLHPLQTPAA